MVAAMYAAASYATRPPCGACAAKVSGSAVSLGSAVFCLGAVIIAGTLGWMYVEIDPGQLKRLASEGEMARSSRMLKDPTCLSFVFHMFFMFISMAGRHQRA